MKLKPQKYDPLKAFLKQQDTQDIVRLSFREIEQIIQAPLPASAQRTRAWWTNSGRSRTTQNRAWLSSGWLVDCVDFNAQYVVFRPQHIPERITPIKRRPTWPPDKVKALRKFAGWTQQELADRMGVRQQTVSEWETGLHRPQHSTSKHLNLIAREIKFPFQVNDH